MIQHRGMSLWFNAKYEHLKFYCLVLVTKNGIEFARYIMLEHYPERMQTTRLGDIKLSFPRLLLD